MLLAACKDEVDITQMLDDSPEHGFNLSLLVVGVFVDTLEPIKTYDTGCLVVISPCVAVT